MESVVSNVKKTSIEHKWCARDYAKPFTLLLDKPMVNLQRRWHCGRWPTTLSGCKGSKKIFIHLVHLFHGGGVRMGINTKDLILFENASHLMGCKWREWERVIHPFWSFSLYYRHCLSTSFFQGPTTNQLATAEETYLPCLI